jgi:threonine dehydratase
MYTTDPGTVVSLQSIYAAREAIRGLALRTPLVQAESLGAGARQVRLKLESAQPVGAFKIRGVANALARLDPAAHRRGVVCASTGNHGRALAYAAQRLDARATVCLSRLVPENKLALVRRLGADLRIRGDSQDEAQAECTRLAAEEGLTEVPPFDHPDVIAGQGTIGLEILEDFADVDTVVVPVSGGGLIAGIALAMKAASTAIRVIGVSMDRGAAMHASLAAGRPVEVKEEKSLADSLGGGIGLTNRFTFNLVRALVDEIRLVPETAIARAMRRLFSDEGWVAEGAGAIGLALLEEAHQSHLGERVAIVISGRNVDMALFRRVVAGELPL